MRHAHGKSFALLALWLGLASCQSSSADAEEWFEVGTNAYFRDESATPEVDDAMGWTLGGGLEFTEGNLHVGPELFVTGSQHDVAGGLLGLDSGGDLEAYTYGVGVRLAHEIPNTELGLHLRAGAFFRDERNKNGATVAQDQGGYYLGAGLEWWFEKYTSLSLGVVHLHREEDGFDELAVMLSARFSFEHSLGLD